MTQMMVKIGKKGEEKERNMGISLHSMFFYLNWLHYISAVDYVAHSENWLPWLKLIRRNGKNKSLKKERIKQIKKYIFNIFF